MHQSAKWILGALALTWLGCGSDSSSQPSGLTPGDGGGVPAKGRYAVSVIVFGPNNSAQTYVTSQDSLDITAVDTTRGREFGGQANIAAYDGHLFISEGDAPRIRRFTLSDEGALKEDGAINFSEYGVSSVSVDARYNTFVSPTKAYTLVGNGTHVVWNPTTLEIIGSVETPNLVRAGYDLWGSSGAARGNRLYRVFYWIDWKSYDSPNDEQYLATYDTDTNKLVSFVRETRCPALGANAITDEKGTIYFSNWFYNVPGTLQRSKPKSCALRLQPGTDALDPNWSLVFSELTKGHEGAQLSYIRNGKAVFAAFHEEEMVITRDTSPYQIASSPNWEAWSVDLASPQAAAPLSGIERMGAQQTFFQIDGRTFLFAPNKAFDTTKAYEIATDGPSRLAFTIAGWSRGFLKIR